MRLANKVAVVIGGGQWPVKLLEMVVTLYGLHRRCNSAGSRY